MKWDNYHNFSGFWGKQRQPATNGGQTAVKVELDKNIKSVKALLCGSGAATAVVVLGRAVQVDPGFSQLTPRLLSGTFSA